MKKNKKAFLFLISVVVSVFLVGTFVTTYAWFLSRYNKEYDFILDSESPIIIKYESELSFAANTTIASSQNILVPATEKTLTGIEYESLDPMDVFDVDTVNPAHTGKVRTAAHAVKFYANGAYWTGYTETIGLFRPELSVFTSAFMGSSALSTYLDGDTLTADNLLTVLEEEEEIVTPTDRLVTRNDQVKKGNVGYFMIFNYLGNTILYYDGTFYLHGAQSGADFTLPAAAESDAELRYWHVLDTTSTISYGEGTVNLINTVGGVDYLRLQTNTTFTFTLYVFMTQTDEEIVDLNGERLTFFASLKIEKEESAGGND